MHAAVLRYFDHVARQGSIRKAAEALSVASSAVNRQILRLEDEIGVPLFERSRAGVRPTAAGELLLRHVRETQIEFQRAQAEIASLAGTVSGTRGKSRPLMHPFNSTSPGDAGSDSAS
jgi:DNA-binding transcriptional LysR family regulator